MSDRDDPQQKADAGERYALRVIRIDPGESGIFRTLSEEYGGVLTHWVRGRSVLCDGESCPSLQHRSGTFWKGYALVQQWFQGKLSWYTCVLEITENLELDLRGRFARGQIWLLHRAAQVGKHKTSVVGVLKGNDPTSNLPPPFNFTPVLRNLYHVPSISLDHKNPMPARIFVQPLVGELPSCIKSEPDIPCRPEEVRRLAERMKGLLGADRGHEGLNCQSQPIGTK